MSSLPAEQLTIRWGRQGRHGTEDTHVDTHIHTDTQERKGRKMQSEGFGENSTAWRWLLEPEDWPAADTV